MSYNKEKLEWNGIAMADSLANLRGMAERFYKSKKLGAEVVLRESISNAIHACLIKKQKLGDSYTPKILLNIDSNKKEITIKDNGIGFSLEDKEIFKELAKPSLIKKRNNLPSKGVGRLAFVYYSKSCLFTTINDTLSPRGLSFDYPEKEGQLPFFTEYPFETLEESGTCVQITIHEPMFEAFINKHKEDERLQSWTLEQFAYLFNSLKNLEFKINFDERSFQVELEKTNEDFFDFECEEKTYRCDVCIVESKKTSLILVAHKLAVNSDKVTYDRQFNSSNKRIYIASEILDEHVSADGLYLEDLGKIIPSFQQAVYSFLDKKFKELIEGQKKQNQKTLEIAKKDFPFLEEFMPAVENITGYKIEKQENFIEAAIEEKGIVEKKFWKQDEGEMDPRLGKSALYLYAKHRENILSLVSRALGNENFSEDEFHGLLTDRGCVDLAKAKHNLWLLDDKFSYFTEGHNAKRGEKVVDVEFYSCYMDAEELPQNLVLIELKKPTQAHNAGEMLEQIKKYASQTHQSGKTANGTDIDTEQCVFFGYVIANAKDIKKELDRRDDDSFRRIAYTQSSYEGTIKFPTKIPGIKKDFHVTLLATQDLLGIARKRNQVLFDLLRRANP